MAAAPGLPLWLLLLGMPWRVPGHPEPDMDRRFSEHKLCTDADCSLLMHRAEALEDFTGPDCRFLNFKKGDSVYVYYKLAGKSPEVWAGTVGRIFGYFPKALIKVLQTYAEKELQIPADETDFVCFDSGRDDFDNYNLEELLGFLKLYNFATGDSKKAIEKTSQHVEKPPEVSEERDPALDSAQATAEDRQSALPGNTKEQEESSEAQETRPHRASAPTEHSQGERSSLDPFEEMLQDKLKVQDSENNKTSNSSQTSNEQERVDAYKLLKKEMTLDLKTKFGSTADALVSDDETTRLVTSLEDDLDEESDAEYYVIGKEEEEEDQENFDEIPLLTYTDEEDLKMPATSEVGKHSADKEQNSSEEDQVEVTQPLRIRSDDEDLTAWEDTVISTVTDGEEQTGMDFDSYSSEEEEESDDGLVPDSKWREPQLPTDYTDSKKAEDGLPVAEVPKASNEKDPETDPELHDEGKGGRVEDSERSLVQGTEGVEEEKTEARTLRGPTQGSNLNPLGATEKGKETLKSVFSNKEHNPKGGAAPVSHAVAWEEKPGEQTSGGGSESRREQRAAGSLGKEGKMTPEATDVTALLGDDQHDASKDGVEEEVDILVNGPKPHTVSVEHLSERFKEEQLLKTQNQPRFSSPDEIGLSAGLEDEGPILGRNLSWQQERDTAAVVTTPAREETRLSAEEVPGDAVGREPVHPRPGTPEAETVGWPGSAEVPGSHTEKPEAEDADYIPEELLEDENAASAKQSKEKSPERQDRQFEVRLQEPERGILGAMNTDAETEANKEKNSHILETDRKNETGGKEEGTLGKEPGGLVAEKESPLADKKAQRPPEGSDFPDKNTQQTPESGEVFQNRESAYITEDSPKGRLQTSGLGEKPGAGLSQEDREDGQTLTDTQSRGDAPGARAGDAPHPTAGAEAELGHGGHSVHSPIISSFFKEQQSLRRFQKYFDVHELEAMFQKMSLKLKSAQQESPPYGVEKALDKVFRAAESQILNAAEEMLDARVTELRDLGMKKNIFEEAAVLDDVQDLIYFVRYRHSAGRGTGPLAMAQPSEQGWDRPAEEVQPPLEDNPSQENTEDLKMQISEEPVHLDQPMTSNMGISEVSQKLNTEKDVHPGMFVTESTAVNDVDEDEEEEPEIPDEEPLENAFLFMQSFMSYLTKSLLPTLPGDVLSASDFYGLPWKPVLITAFLGIVSFVIFFWRTILAVKSHMYQVTEQQISEKLNILKKENADLVQKLSNYEQKIKESKKYVQETKKQNMILSDEAIKYKDKIKELEETKENLNDKAKNLRLMLESEREQNAKNEDLILENKQSLDKLKDVIAMNASELSEVQIALNEAKLSEEKVKSECHRVQEENAKLKKKKDQLQQEIKDLKKAYTEVSEQIKSFEKSQKDLEVALTQKDDNINALTNCITQLNWLDCESESERQNKTGNESDELANGEVRGDRSEKMKNQIKQMMDVSRTQTEISVVEEDLKLLQLKLRASISTKCNLEDQIKKLEDDRSSLQSARAGLEEENKTLKQKVEILNELYQQKEMALQKKLSQEEYERREREQRLSAADEKALSAAEEIKTYRWRIEELENELQKTERSFKDQLAANEKKAHDNWLKARAAERAMAEEKREAANLRHKLLELNQKVAMLQQEPVIVKPMPGRPSAQNAPRRGPLSQNGSFGPSPVSGGECSPPLRDPPARPLSATLSRREVPQSEFDPGSGAAATVNSSPRSSSPARGMDEGKVHTAAEGPPPFPGAPLMSAPLGGPVPPPIRYGPPPQLCGPFGARPFPPPFGPGMRPPLGLREYAPGVPPGKRDVPFDPRGFVPGHPHFRPVASPGPREYFIPGPRPPPPPTHGPQDYPPPAARDLLPSGSREDPPPASQSSSQDTSQALRQSP